MSHDASARDGEASGSDDLDRGAGDDGATAARAELLRHIARRTARVAVVGMGYTGLPVAAAFVEAGYRVLGHDVDEEKVARLNAGETDLKHLGAGLVAGMRASGRFEATADAARLAESDVVLVCVPTPLGPERQPDLSAVRDAGAALGRTLHVGQLIVLESTTYPGTTRDEFLPTLLASGLRPGIDFFLAYSPEREDPGRDMGTRQIPRLVGGIDEASRDVAVALFETVLDQVVPVSSAEIAEAAKLLENIYRAVNIAMVNEMKVLLTALDLDVHEVIDAASTKPFGYQPFRPGPGMGGHCIPIDPFYMAYKAEQVGQQARFIALAGEINHAMPGWVVERTAEALVQRGVDLDGARVLVVGLAYKADIDDVRESPSFALISRFGELGATVDYHDPHVPRTRAAWHPGRPPLESVPLDEASLSGYDAVVIATDHRAVDYQLLGRAARLVIDTRGVMRGLGDEGIVMA